MKQLIATHDSATGEKPLWWCALLTPFARTQFKTIGEQYADGCTMFDIRVKKVGRVWRCAHGWWFTKRSFESIMDELDWYAQCCHDVIVFLTYEGKAKNAAEFVEYAKWIKEKYPAIKFGEVSAKYGKDSKGLKVKYDILIPGDVHPAAEQAFLPLDGKHWQTFLPIPLLWKQFYFRDVEFNDHTYKFVDFL